MKAVAGSELGKREKAVLNALIPYIRFGVPQASCYPSMQKLSHASGWGERSVQGAMKKLERLGVVRVSPGPQGWKTYTRTLSFSALSVQNPAAPAGVDGETPARPAEVEHSEPRTPCARPPQQVRGTPAGRAPQPRRVCAQTTIEPSIELPEELEGGAHATDGMDGTQADETRKRQALRALKDKGVQGKNLDRLADSSHITPELIEQEWARIKGADGVRKDSAVLVRVLERHAGIELRSQQAMAGMDPADKQLLMEAQARLEKRRRDAQLAAS